MKHDGLEPGRDVSLLPMGGSAAGRYAVLETGVVDASFLSVPENIIALEKGYNELIFAGDVVEFPQNGFGTSEKKIRENADEVYRMVRATLRGLQFVWDKNNQEAVTNILMKQWKINDPKMAADMRAVARATPDLAAAARLSAVLPYWNSMMRTTCVATRLAGGHAQNALPQLATANVNCRILPGLSPESVKDTLVRVLADSKIAVSFVGQAQPSKPSPLRPDLMTAVESLTRQMFPGVVVVPVMGTGATDGLYLRNGEIPTYGIAGSFEDIDDVRAHGRDERIGIKQYFEGLEFQYRLIKALAGRP